MHPLATETSVVSVLRNRHELDGVVAHALHPGEDVPGEVCVGRHLGLARRHADMSLVDLKVRRLGRALVLEDVLFLLRRLPMHAVEQVRGVVLPREPGPCRHPLDPLAS